MPDNPYTPAELDAGAEALAIYLTNICVDTGLVVCYPATAAVLDAATPLITARVRGQVAAEIAQAIEDLYDPYPHPCAPIARRHATPPTEGDADAAS